MRYTREDIIDETPIWVNEEEEEDLPFKYEPDEQDKRVSFECVSSIEEAGHRVRGQTISEDDYFDLIKRLPTSQDRTVFATWLAVNGIQRKAKIDITSNIVSAILDASDKLQGNVLYESDYDDIVNELNTKDSQVFATWLTSNEIIVRKGSSRVRRAARRLRRLPARLEQNYESILFAKGQYIKDVHKQLKKLTDEEILKLKSTNPLLDVIIDEYLGSV